MLNALVVAVPVVQDKALLAMWAVLAAAAGVTVLNILL